MNEKIIFTWGVRDKYHHMTFHNPIRCVDFLNRQDITGPDDVL